MAVKLHRCKNMWAKFGTHPCWKVQKALDEQGIDYEVVPGPWPSRKKRTAVIAGTGSRSTRRSSSRTAAGIASSRRTWCEPSAKAS